MCPPLFSELEVREFYQAVLPTVGDYFVVTIEKANGRGITRQRKVKSVDDLLEAVDGSKDKDKYNTYYAVGGFGDKKKTNYAGKEVDSRAADNCLYFRAFYLDLDCKGDDKSYANKQAALLALKDFVSKTNLPKPVLVDSGNGIHPYWPLDRDIDKAEWVSTASVFKDLCSKLEFTNDPTVVADAARIMRCPDTNNWNTEDGTPRRTKLLTPIKTFNYEEIKQKILDAAEQAGVSKPAFDFTGYIRVQEDDEELQEYVRAKYENYETKFRKILMLKDEGCAQINYIVANQATMDEPRWRAVLSVAQVCDDRNKAIHLISKNHPEYDYDETERKAHATRGPYRCETFESIDASKCEGCIHKGRFSSPIELGRQLKEPQPVVDEQGQVVKEREAFPPELYPFVRGPNGGIFYQPPPEYDKNAKKKIAAEPYLVYPYDIEIYDRLYSKHSGENIALNIHLPLDPVREFYVPLSVTNAAERFKEAMSSKGVVVANKNYWEHLMSYTNKWAAYLQSVKRLSVLRDQLGWSEDGESFALGNTEYFRDGTERPCPPSDSTRKIAKYFHPSGDFKTWKKAFNQFAKPGFENHAIFALSGFSSPLMRLANIHGITLVAYGEDAGTGKTISIKGALSIWGDPTEQLVTSTTENARIQRMSALNSLPYGSDEQTNIMPEALSNFIYASSLGSHKVRMNASSNTEREDLPIFHTHSMMSTNEDFYQKLKSHRADPEGEFARCIQIEFHMPSTMNADWAREHLEPLNANCGHAGITFIKYVVCNVEAIKKRIEENCRRFSKDFDAQSKHRYWVNWVGTLLTGSEISKKLGLHDYDIEHTYRHLLKKLRAIELENAGKIGEASDILQAFIYSNTSNMLVVDSTADLRKTPSYIPARIPLSFKGLVMRVEPDADRLYVIQSALLDYLKEKKFSPKRFEESLLASNTMLGPPKKVRIARAWGSAPQTPVTAYTFNIKVDINSVNDDTE